MKYYLQIGRTYFFTTITGDSSSQQFLVLLNLFPRRVQKAFLLFTLSASCNQFRDSFAKMDIPFPDTTRLRTESTSTSISSDYSSYHIIYYTTSFIDSWIFNFVQFYYFYLLYSFSFRVTTLLLRFFIILIVISSDDIVFLDLLLSHIHFAVFSFQSYFYFVFIQFYQIIVLTILSTLQLRVCILGSSPFSFRSILFYVFNPCLSL